MHPWYLAALFSVVTVSTGCDDGPCLSERCVEEEIRAANYCTVADDCASAGSVCPFGCDIRVHRDELERILSLLDAFESRCEYDCGPTTEVACENNACVTR